MSINKLNAQGASRTYVQNSDTARADAAARVKDADAAESQRPRADSVELSVNARAVSAAREAVNNAPDVRQDKVNQIKQRLDSGTYEVPARVLARKMLDSTNTQP